MPDVTAGAVRAIARASARSALTFLALAVCATAPGRAQDVDVGDYPNRPIHIIVPFPAGGPTDLLSRIIGKEMTASWARPVVIENRPGADTTIGAELVAKADPDGYTLLAAMDSTMVLNPLVKKDLPYDPFKDFEPLMVIGASPNVFVVPTQSKTKTMSDFIAAAKAAVLSFWPSPAAPKSWTFNAIGAGQTTGIG